MEEMVVDERDNDSLVVLLFIFIWFLFFWRLGGRTRWFELGRLSAQLGVVVFLEGRLSHQAAD